MSNHMKRRTERNRDKAVDSGNERDAAERSIAQRSHRASHPSNRPKPPRPIIQINGDVTIKGNVTFGAPNEDQQSSSTRSSPFPARSNSGIAQPKKRREPALISEDFESIDSASCSSREASPAPSLSRTLKSRSPPSTPALAAGQNDGTWRDEGYGTGASTRGNSTKRVKAEALSPEFTNGLSRVSSSGSLEKSGTQRKTKRPKPPSLKSDIEDGAASDDDTNLERKGDDSGDIYDSDDDFAKRTIKVCGASNKEIEIRVILDTGTKPNWVCSYFLEDELKLIYSKLSEDQNYEFRDFNGKRFKALGQVELSIFSDEFKGFPCRSKTFLVARDCSFKMLLGKNIIKEEGLLIRKPRDLSGEGTYPGFQTDPKKEEQAEMARKKAEQQKLIAEQKKQRDEKRRMEAKQRQDSRSHQLANFAPESKPRHRRSWSRSRSRSRSISLTRNPKSLTGRRMESPRKPAKMVVQPKKSSSSLEGTW